MATIKEALRRGTTGYVQDVFLLARAWGFALADIEAPIQLWHGDVDTVVPLHHAYHLAEAVHSTTLRICPGEGHMVMWSTWRKFWQARQGRARTVARPARRPEARDLENRVGAAAPSGRRRSRPSPGRC